MGENGVGNGLSLEGMGFELGLGEGDIRRVWGWDGGWRRDLDWDREGRGGVEGGLRGVT